MLGAVGHNVASVWGFRWEAFIWKWAFIWSLRKAGAKGVLGRGELTCLQLSRFSGKPQFLFPVSVSLRGRRSKGKGKGIRAPHTLSRAPKFPLPLPLSTPATQATFQSQPLLCGWWSTSYTVSPRYHCHFLNTGILPKWSESLCTKFCSKFFFANRETNKILFTS